MKKIISLTLAALMLVTLLVTVTSCEVSMEGMTGYTRLRDHVIAAADPNGEVALDGKAQGFASVKLIAPIKQGEDKPEAVQLIAEGRDANTKVLLPLTLTGSTEKAEVVYRVISMAEEKDLVKTVSTVLLTHYTGSEQVTFTEMEGFHFLDEASYRSSVTSMLNCALQVLDTYTAETLDMSVTELGFIALDDNYMADRETVEAEEDLGGAFSPARLSMAGLMIIQGVGMVFLVLAILWLVLLIFKKVFYKDPAKQEKKEDAPVEAPAPVAAPADDGALVAAITAAVAAYIDSDPALSSRFAGGFRVVSFKKKNGKTSWNH